MVLETKLMHPVLGPSEASNAFSHKKVIVDKEALNNVFLLKHLEQKYGTVIRPTGNKNLKHFKTLTGNWEEKKKQKKKPPYNNHKLNMKRLLPI